MTVPSIAVGVCGLVCAALALTWSAVSDVRAYEIPNVASLAVGMGYLAFAAVTPAAPRLEALVAGLAVLAAGLILFARGWMGGGDVKLMSAVALWCGPSLLASFAIVTGLVGAVIAAVMLTPFRRLMPPAPPTAIASIGAGTALTQPMPFGVAIALGGAWVLAQRAGLLR